MNIHRLVAMGTAALIAGGCADTGDLLAPPAVQGHSAELSTLAARQVPVSGTFDAIVDFSTLTLTPRGGNCLLQAQGQLVFAGTIEGVATGQTSALVFAPCADVAMTPPGTYPDVFRSEAIFEGTVDGEPVRANVLYMGRVQPGGHIEGRLVMSRGVQGRLEVEAQVAVGGEYHGTVVVN
jgi:hypothetical protein